MSILVVLEILFSIGVGLFGFNALILTMLYLRHARRQQRRPGDVQEWPTVVVQVPVYNECHVIERIIDSVAALDYPRDRLTIQIADDSTDETIQIARARIDFHRAQGINIRHVRRARREGYKAGALDYALKQTDAEFVAIFDADCLPNEDFLRQVIPHFLERPRVGIVQTRWAYINNDYSLLTRIQALALDAHFVVEQTARQRSGLLMHFNGTAGMLRRECIEDSGGWQHDTLSEDMDISFRAQLAGWQCQYLPEVSVPTELPPTMLGLKLQQRRWSTGTVQCLRKLGGRVLRARLNPWQKLQAILQLSGYFVHPLMILLLLISIPLMLSGRTPDVSIGALSLGALGPPLMIAVSQTRLHKNWPQRLLYLPFLILLGFGVAANNTRGLINGFQNSKPFDRTPKFNLNGSSDQWVSSQYNSAFEWSILFEAALAIYAVGALIVSLDRQPGMAFFLGVYALGFSYVAGLGLWQAGKVYFNEAKGNNLQATLDIGGAD